MRIRTVAPDLTPSPVRRPPVLSDEHRQALNDIAMWQVVVDECLIPGENKPWGGHIGNDESRPTYVQRLAEARAKIVDLRGIIAREERLAQDRARASELMLGLEERAEAARRRADAIALALEENDAEGLRLLAEHAPWAELRRRAAEELGKLQHTT